MNGESISVDAALLVLKVLFLVVLYFFIWRIVRSAARDVSLPQESFILRPGEAQGFGGQSTIQSGRLVVLKSPALDEGAVFELDSATRASSRGATACGCRIAARRTARTSTALGSSDRAGSRRATSSASARPT